MRLAYSDPPYPGCASYYPEDEEVCVFEAMFKLIEERYDGWALSTHQRGLQMLGVLPEGVRVAVWVKPWAVHRPRLRIQYHWEPVIYQCARPLRAPGDRCYPDFVIANATSKRGCVGAKPVDFCWWLFALMGARPGDTLDDVYPGSGVVGREFEAFSRCGFPAELAVPFEALTLEGV